jgi:hypothetical protein
MGGNANIIADLQLSAMDSPSEGPRGGPLILDFSKNNPIRVDLSQQQVQTRISMVQTIYIDLADSDDKITVLVERSLHRIRAKGRTQGFYTVLAPSPTSLLFTSTGADIITVHIVNVPIAGVVWATQ